MACANDPGENKRQNGVCHCCAMRPRLHVLFQPFAGPRGRQFQMVRFCSGCCHWFCEQCWEFVMSRRFVGFMEKLIVGLPDGCCGPKEVWP